MEKRNSFSVPLTVNNIIHLSSGYRAVVVSGIKPELILHDCLSFQVQAQTNTSVYLLNPTLASWSD